MINIENLRKIYNFIDTLPDERVNMSNWRTDPSGYPDPTLDLNICGTAACVVGWLPVIFDKKPPQFFRYTQFALKVGCTYYEAMCVCHCSSYELRGYDVGVPRTKQDALRSMHEMATKYGYTL
jgi:hypothetical protein